MANFFGARDPSILLSTELNALANAAKVVTSELVWPRKALIDLELYIAGFGGVPVAGAYCDIYFVPALDGTNYCDGVAAGIDPPTSTWQASFPLRAVNAAQRVVITDLPVPPWPFKIVMFNRSGQALTAVNTHKLTMRVHE